MEEALGDVGMLRQANCQIMRVIYRHQCMEAMIGERRKRSMMKKQSRNA
jgi:hypothetical protein